MDRWSALLNVVVIGLVAYTGLASARLAIATVHHGNMETFGGSDTNVQVLLILGCVVNETDTSLRIESRWSYEEELIDIQSQQSAFYNRALISSGRFVMGGVMGTQLVVQRLTYRDAGRFTCEARMFGDPSDDWVSVNIQVTLLVRLDAIAREVQTFNDSQYVNLACDMASYIRPDRELYWTRNGETIEQSDSRYTVSYTNGSRVAQFGDDDAIPSRVSTLTILDPEVQDSGDSYGCAINNTDLAEEIRLTVLAASSPDGPPQNVTAVSLSSTEILVTWDEVLEGERNGNITSYDVLFFQSTYLEIPLSMNITTQGPERRVILQNLEEHLEYSILVRASTIVGAGPYSFSITSQTLQAVPTSYPSNIQVNAISSTALQVSWEAVPGIQQNGVITHYTIQYNQSTFASIPSSVLSVSANASASGEGVTGEGVTGGGVTVLGGLEEFVEYGVRMRAHTVVGEGPLSPFVSSVTLQDRPSAAPKSLAVVPLNISSLGVTWSSPSEIDVNGILTHYVLTYCPLSGGALQNCTSLNAPPDTTRIALSNLQEFFTYNVSVAAHTIDKGPAAMDIETTELIAVETEPDSLLELGPLNPVSTVNFTCAANTSSNNQLIWRWKHNDEDIITSGGSGDRHVIHLTNEASILEIGRLTSEDSGNYICSLTFPFWGDISIASNSVDLQLNYRIEATATVVEASERSPSVNLSCVLFGYIPSTDLQWFQLGRNGRANQLSSNPGKYLVAVFESQDDKKRVIQRGRNSPDNFNVQTVLTFLRPAVEDSGSYFCGLVGGAMRRIELNVLSVTGPTGGITPKPEFPVAGVVLGVVIGVFLIVLLVVVVIAVGMVCSRKRQTEASGEIIVVATNGELAADEDEEFKKVPLDLLEQNFTPDTQDILENTAVDNTSVNSNEQTSASECPAEAGPLDIDLPVEVEQPNESGQPDPPVEAEQPDPPVESGQPNESGQPDPPVESGQPDSPVESGQSNPPVESGQPDPPVESGQPVQAGQPSESGQPDPPIEIGLPEIPVKAGQADQSGQSLELPAADTEQLAIAAVSQSSVQESVSDDEKPKLLEAVAEDESSSMAVANEENDGFTNPISDIEASHVRKETKGREETDV